MHHCIAYTDDSMRKFFHRVQHAPWFKNTLFVILADHTSELAEASSINARGLFEIPILFYHPSDPNLHGVDSTHVVQQTDILPSILGYLNDPTPCLAFGGNIFAPREKTFAFNYFDPVWQLYQDGWLLQFDGERTVGFYDYVHDTYMKQNLVDTRPEQADMERLIKALIQQYMNLVSDNRLTAE